MSDTLRLIRAQQRQVSKVLLDGLYDPDSPLSNLLGVRTEVVGEIIWQKMLVENWQIYPGQKTLSGQRQIDHLEEDAGCVQLADLSLLVVRQGDFN